MLMIRCAEPINTVNAGFTCLVGVRTLRHLTTPSMVNTMIALGTPYKDLDKASFTSVLAALSIPVSAVVNNADWSGR
jgi:hypothetical protein